MMERISPKAPTLEKAMQAESKEHTKSTISLDGESIEVEKSLGENIAIALRMQDKIDEALMTGSKPGLLNMVRMLNCRKAISAVRGTVPLSELVSRKNYNKDRLSEEEREELSGLPDLITDLENILDSGRSPVLGSKEDTHCILFG